MPIVLVQNERTVGGAYDHWNDIEGVRYQYPNNYKNLIRQGEQFVYYRGTRRDGGGRGNPEYFGCGVIGTIWRDESVPENRPRGQWKWYCQVINYLAFPQPVLARQQDGQIEQPGVNWRSAVRRLPIDMYNRILNLGGITQLDQASKAIVTNVGDARLSSKQTRKPLLLARPKSARFVSEKEEPSQLFSVCAKAIGDVAEGLVFKFLARELDKIGGSDLRWISREGKKPGWDIQFTNSSDAIIAVEVKGTSAQAFNRLELTHNEWQAALCHKDRYWLFLVANCLSANPSFQVLENPAQKSERGEISIRPSRYKLEIPIETKLMAVFRTAIARFIETDSDYILSGIHEQSLCSRLARELENAAMQSGLRGYYGDAENNRKQDGKVKTIVNEDEEEVQVTCDAILHSRGEIAKRDNLIALEMKKSNRLEASKNKDRKRLRALTMPVSQLGVPCIWSADGIVQPEHVCGYELGVFLELNISERVLKAEYFSHGNFSGSVQEFPL